MIHYRLIHDNINSNGSIKTEWLMWQMRVEALKMVSIAHIQHVCKSCIFIESKKRIIYITNGQI